MTSSISNVRKLYPKPFPTLAFISHPPALLVPKNISEQIWDTACVKGYQEKVRKVARPERGWKKESGSVVCFVNNSRESKWQRSFISFRDPDRKGRFCLPGAQIWSAGHVSSARRIQRRSIRVLSSDGDLIVVRRPKSVPCTSSCLARGGLGFLLYFNLWSFYVCSSKLPSTLYGSIALTRINMPHDTENEMHICLYPDTWTCNGRIPVQTTPGTILTFSITPFSSSYFWACVQYSP